MATLEYSVTGQRIATTAAAELVSGTIGFYTTKFTFDSAWDSFGEKWAVFSANPGNAYKQPLDANGECPIPGEVMGAVQLRIGVYGVAAGVEYPTVWANRLQLIEGCYIEAVPSDWPEPSPVISRLEEALENKVDKPEAAEPGNVAIFDTNRNISDSGKSLSDIYDSAMISKTVSGDIVTITDGANVPIKEMTVEIYPHYDTSATPTASSPLSIHPTRSRLPLNISGKNLIGGMPLVHQIQRYLSNVTVDETEKTVTIVGASGNAATANIGYLLGVIFDPQKTYTVIARMKKGTNSSRNSNVRIYKANGSYSTITYPSGFVANEKYTIISTSTLTGMTKASNGGTDRIYYDEFGVFEGTVTEADFEPYIGYQTDVKLPVDVYRGTLNPITGELLVRPVYESYAGEQLDYPVLSSKDGYMTSGTPTAGSLVIDYGGTPTVYQCDPVALVTHRGINTVSVGFPAFASSPDKASTFGLTYRADPTMAMDAQAKAIKESIAPVEDGTASRAYRIGEFFYVGDVLYQTTAGIASGATITPGTNCRVLTVGEMLSYILEELY